MIDQIRVVAPESVAKILCAALRAWMQNGGDWSMPSWEELPNSGRTAITQIVRVALRHDGVFAAKDIHELVSTTANMVGWSGGDVHDLHRMKSPYLYPWEILPERCVRAFELAELQLAALSKWGTK